MSICFVRKDKKKGPLGLLSESPCYAHGAGGRIRTAYLLITNQLLYRLSYAGRNCESSSYHAASAMVKLKPE